MLESTNSADCSFGFDKQNPLSAWDNCAHLRWLWEETEGWAMRLVVMRRPTCHLCHRANKYYSMVEHLCSSMVWRIFKYFRAFPIHFTGAKGCCLIFQVVDAYSKTNVPHPGCMTLLLRATRRPVAEATIRLYRKSILSQTLQSFNSALPWQYNS